MLDFEQVVHKNSDEKTPQPEKEERPDDSIEKEKTLIEAIKFQEEKFSQHWDLFFSSIMNKDFESDKCEEDLKWFTDKCEKTKDLGYTDGSWIKMNVELSKNNDIAKLVDGYQGMKVLDPVTHRELAPERLKAVNDIAVAGAKFRDRMIFFEQLLNSTTEILNTAKDARDQQQQKMVVSVWSDVLSRFKMMRQEDLNHRLEQLLPLIDQQKKALINYCQEAFPEQISPAGVKRVEEVKVRIRDEYMETGAGWNNSGSYNNKDKEIMLSGRESLAGEDSLSSTISHELAHALSGHGDKEDLELHGHIISMSRVGIRETWLNESFTEKLSGKITKKNLIEQSYSFESQVYDLLIDKYNISEEDMARLYFNEGDDSTVRNDLNNKYPGVLETLAKLERIKKRGRAFEEVISEPDILTKVVETIYGEKKEAAEREVKLRRINQLNKFLYEKLWPMLTEWNILSDKFSDLYAERIKKTADLGDLYPPFNEELIEKMEQGMVNTISSDLLLGDVLRKSYNTYSDLFYAWYPIINIIPLKNLRYQEASVKNTVSSFGKSLRGRKKSCDEWEKENTLIPSHDEALKDRVNANQVLIKLKMLDPSEIN